MRSLSQLEMDKYDGQVCREWLETLSLLDCDLRECVALACDGAAGNAASVRAEDLDRPTQGRLAWAPARLIDSIPLDVLLKRDKASGVVKLRGGSQLRPLDQILITAIIEVIVADIASNFFAVSSQDHQSFLRLSQNLKNLSPTQNSNCCNFDDTSMQSIDEETWFLASIWSNGRSGATILRRTLRAVPVTASISPKETKI